MNIFQCRIVEVLGCGDKSAKENPFECPLLKCDMEMRSCPIDVDEGSENDGNGNLRSSDDGVDKVGKGVYIGLSDVIATMRGVERTTDGVVDGV